MSVLECIVADSSGSMKLLCYNRSAFAMLKENSSVMLLNFIPKSAEIVITSDGKVMKIPNVEVPPDVCEAANNQFAHLHHKAENITVLDAYDKSQGTVVSVTVKVVQVDEMQTVQTTYGETNVRNGICADETQSIPFAFWRKLASVNIADGDCIKIINAVVSKTTDGQPKLSGNQRTAIEFLPKDTIVNIKGVGTFHHETEGNVVAIGGINTYSSCSRKACYQKKLVENKCPKCQTIYEDMDQKKAMSCQIAIQTKDDNMDTVTIFTNQIKDILPVPVDDFPADNNNNIEDMIVQNLPIRVGFTKSPQKDSNTLAMLKKL